MLFIDTMTVGSLKNLNFYLRIKHCRFEICVSCEEITNTYTLCILKGEVS